jgi:hypothetical protein
MSLSWSVQVVLSNNLLQFPVKINQIYILKTKLRLGINATFNNISVISWWSVFLVEEIGIPTENDRPVASH